ncbi:MAG: YqhV family protein [Anoxybacillus sp.]|nr:YqhV family protein [Anoxybacillus sp.]MCL6587060.1 YqhV family protein [Anoxybacillus sp.]
MKRWLALFDATVLSMAGLRVLSAAIELTAAITMLMFNDVKKAVAVNALLAVVGPIIFIATMTIGLLSLTDELSFAKLFWIGLGVAFILFGIYK